MFAVQRQFAEKDACLNLDKTKKEKGLSNNWEGHPAERDVIIGRNAVAEALRAQRVIDRLFVQRGEKSGALLTLIAKAKEAGAVIKEVDSRKLDHLCAGAVHQIGRAHV